MADFTDHLFEELAPLELGRWDDAANLVDRLLLDEEAWLLLDPPDDVLSGIDQQPPLLTVAPPGGSVLGADDPVVIEATDDRVLAIVTVYAGDRVIYDGTAFSPDYATSSRVFLTNGVRLIVRRVNGWQQTVSVEAAVIDSGGNLRRVLTEFEGPTPIPPVVETGGGGLSNLASARGVGPLRAPADFREHMLNLAPPWLAGVYGQRLMGAMGLIFDAMAEGSLRGMLMRHLLSPLYPKDALPLHGAERRLLRYPGESEQGYRARVHDAWRIWRLAGTYQGVEEQLGALGFKDIQFLPAKAGTTLDDNLAHWSRVWIVASHPLVKTVGTLGQKRMLGDGGTIGSTASRELVQATRAAVRQFKTGHFKVENIVLVLSGDIEAARFVSQDPYRRPANLRYWGG